MHFDAIFVQHFPDHEREEKSKMLTYKNKLMYVVGNQMYKWVRSFLLGLDKIMSALKFFCQNIAA